MAAALRDSTSNRADQNEQKNINQQTAIGSDAAILQNEATGFDSVALRTRACELHTRFRADHDKAGFGEVQREGMCFVQQASDAIIKIINEAGGGIARRYCKSGYREGARPDLLAGSQNRYIYYDTSAAPWPSECIWLPLRQCSSESDHPARDDKSIYYDGCNSILTELAFGSILDDMAGLPICDGERDRAHQEWLEQLQYEQEEYVCYDISTYLD